MRNLKKILALVLALVMSMSLMATANAFTDDANIEADYEVATKVLAGIGVFQGYPDGSFAPKAAITRQEVAAIMYRIASADVTDKQNALYVEGANFTDVKATDWAAGYIGFCANGGIVKGNGDGTFGPAAQVTGYQVLAMALRAVGYDKNGEFTGADWQKNVATTAQALGILKNVPGTVQLSKPATRELVAELIFQTIATVAQVEYTPAFGYQPVKVWAGALTTLGYEQFKLASVKTYDVWGRPATTWYADANGNGTKEATEKLFATIADKALFESTVKVTGCDLLKALGYAETTTTVVSFDTYTNGVGTGHTATVQSCHNNPAACVAKQHTYGAQGRQMYVYKETAANTYRVVYIDTFFAKIGATTKAPNTHTPTDAVALTVYETNNTGVAYTYTYATGTAAYTKDAYALVTIADGIVKSVTEVAPVATAVKGTYYLNTAAGETTIVGGVTYNDACKFFVGQDTWNATKSWNVYVDAYGNIIGLLEYVAPNTFAYGVITALKWVDTNDLLNSGYVVSNIVKMDATTMANTILKANALIDSDANTTGTQATAFTSSGHLAGQYAEATVSETTQYNGEYADTLFEYTLNTDGSYNITNIGSVVEAAQAIEAGKANLFVGTDGKYMATNDNTVYLVKTGTATAPVYTSYVGYKTVPNMKNVSVQFMKANAAAGVYSDYVYVDATAATYDGQAGYVWFTKDLETADAIGYNATGDKAYLAYIDGVATVVYMDAATEAATLSAINVGKLYKVTRNADGDITGATAIDWTAAGYAMIDDVTGITGTVITNGTVAGTLNVTGAAMYAYTADRSTVTPVAEADWSATVVGGRAYCIIGSDNIVDAIYVPVA